MLKLDNSMTYYEKRYFDIFDTMSASGGKLRAKTLLKTDFYSIFNKFVHWILMKLSGLIVYDDYEWKIISNFKTLSRSDVERDEKTLLENDIKQI